MIKEQTLEIILEYIQLPDTDEKIKIDKKYLNDEIDSFEFFSEANRYLAKAKGLTKP